MPVVTNHLLIFGRLCEISSDFEIHTKPFTIGEILHWNLSQTFNIDWLKA